jgi:hypothetical protein
MAAQLNAQTGADASVAATLRRCEQLLPEAVKVGELILKVSPKERGLYPVPTRMELTPKAGGGHKTTALEKAPSDAWGNPFEMELSDQGVRIWSWGPDGKKRTTDDVKCEPKRSSGTSSSAGRNRLYDASKGGNVTEVRRLLSLGDKPNVTADGGATPLHAVAFAETNRVEIARLLVEAGGDVNFIASSSSPSVPTAAGPAKLGAVPPLHNAVVLDRQDLVEFLIEQGANVNLGESSPLFNALLPGRSYVQILERLLKAGANVNARDEKGFTPIIVAAQSGLDNAVQTLLAHNADPNLRTATGNTALILAVDQGHAGSAAKLIAAQADVNSRNKRGQTALMTAAWHGNVAMVTSLLDAKADSTLKDNTGQTAEQVAQSQGHKKIAELIAQRRR